MPSNVPTWLNMELKTASLTRSEVGRMVLPLNPASFLPLALPLIIRKPGFLNNFYMLN